MGCPADGMAALRYLDSSQVGAEIKDPNSNVSMVHRGDGWSMAHFGKSVGGVFSNTQKNSHETSLVEINGARSIKNVFPETTRGSKAKTSPAIACKLCVDQGLQNSFTSLVTAGPNGGFASFES